MMDTCFVSVITNLGRKPFIGHVVVVVVVVGVVVVVAVVVSVMVFH